MSKSDWAKIVVVGDSLLAHQIAIAGGNDLAKTDAVLLFPEYKTVVETLATLDPIAIVGCAMDGFLLDEVERDPTAIVQRAVLSGQLAISARALNIPYFHVSSHLVFGGSRRAYAPWDEPNPIQAIGMAHLWAENAVWSLGELQVIVRTGWLYGPERQDSFPVRVLTETYEEKVKGETAFHSVYVPEGWLGTPARDVEVAELIALHAATGRAWVANLHVKDRVAHVGPREEPISWYEFCRYVGVPAQIKGKGKRWNPLDGYIPRQQGLASTVGWVTSGYMRSAVEFLRDMGHRPSSSVT